MDTPNGDDSPRSISSTRQPHLVTDEAQSADAAAAVEPFLEFENLPARRSEAETPRRRMTARKNVQTYSSDNSWIDVPSPVAAAAALAQQTNASVQGVGATTSGSELATMLALMQQQMEVIAELQQELKVSKSHQHDDEAWWTEPGSPVQNAGEATVPGPALSEFVQGADLNFSFDERTVATKEAAPRIKEIPELPKLTVPKDISERATAFSL